MSQKWCCFEILCGFVQSLAILTTEKGGDPELPHSIYIFDVNADILETVRGTGKTFYNFALTGVNGIIAVPSENSLTKFNELFCTDD